MYDDIDLIHRKIEEPGGFQNFQSFIHHRGRIDRNFTAHIPGRMIHRIIQCYAFQLFTGKSPERSAGCRQKDLFKRTLRLSHQTLPDRGMLRIHRQKRNLLLFYQRHNDRTRGNQCFFICKSNILSGMDRGNDRRKTFHSDHSAHYAVDFRKSRTVTVSIIFTKDLHFGITGKHTL